MIFVSCRSSIVVDIARCDPRGKQSTCVVWCGDSVLKMVALNDKFAMLEINELQNNMQ